MSLTAIERETIIVMSDDSKLATVWTCQRSMIRKLKANPDASLREEGITDGSPWASFLVQRRLVAVRKARVMTPEQRALCRARMVTKSILDESSKKESLPRCEKIE